MRADEKTPRKVLNSVASRAATRERVKKHREVLSERGFKPVTRWVLDVKNPAVAAEIRRQCIALRDDPAEHEALEFIERAMDYSGWS